MDVLGNLVKAAALILALLAAGVGRSIACNSPWEKGAATSAVINAASSVISISCINPADYLTRDVYEPTPNAIGTAFFVNAQGYFITARHVWYFSQGSNFQRRCVMVGLLPTGSWEKLYNHKTNLQYVDVVGCRPSVNFDLTVCRASPNPFQTRLFSVSAVTFASSQAPANDKVAYMGFPGNSEYLESCWNSTVVRAYDPSYSFELPLSPPLSVVHRISTGLILSGEFGRGYSGGPIFLSNGDIVGLTIGGAGDGYNTVAVPAFNVIKFLRDTKVKAQTHAL